MTSTSTALPGGMTVEKKPWPALWALVIGFFMILVDSTIVSVAIPTISSKLDADINAVIWVTSAYLLAYAVPLLVTGRLGDRFGPKNLYLIGLAVFTLSSLWCGFAGSIEMLIVARVVQGLGAALMTPQTMAVITRMFPPDKRGAAMGLWGAVAGVATLVGPIAGGLLVDSLGWEWIFFVNVPVGIVAFVLAVRLVPQFEKHAHSFDWLGVALSAVGLFLVVFGIQEGETYKWGTITGPVTVWGMIIAGIVVLVAFVFWQRVRKGDALLPLGLFKDRNFTLANIAITAVGLSISSFALPLILWAQDVKGFSPTTSALLLTPMAVVSMGVAPVVGKNLHRWNPRWVAAFGLAFFSGGLFWVGTVVRGNDPWWSVIAPAVVLGLGSGAMWGPLSVAATRNLPPRLAGAGAGVFNTTRQVGAVLGSAAIAAVIEARITANFPAGAGSSGSTGSAGSTGEGATSSLGVLPSFLHAPFSSAMGEAMLLPAAVIIVAFVAALFFAKPQPVSWGAAPAGTPAQAPAGEAPVSPEVGAPESPAEAPAVEHHPAHAAAHHAAHAAAPAPSTPDEELAATEHAGRHTAE
ncbi:DHA2 family efflux MFS transporter permease subunit [Curtobacterium sp. Leaf261]|uniref:DHA2 family efflux MFS transporter permease subunit n=1 Tax=Curtobacterium sp. Leaf261 TaxID=1736311 RepID=UPI000A6E720D|nr:DHA2 family efflux MFS transporter permease subunit [Curtobacterium sp. Leaf261]